MSAQITAATGQWLRLQDEAGKTAAKRIAEQIGVEVQGITGLIQPVDDSERAGLRLELNLRELIGHRSP